MASDRQLLKSAATTEDARPFSGAQENFYFDCTRRDGSDVMTGGHYHGMYEIYFLLSGSCQYFIENKLFDVQAGDIVLIPKGAIHKTIYRGTPTERYLINFSGDYIAPELSEAAGRLFTEKLYRPDKDSIGGIVDIFRKIGEESSHFDGYSRLLITGLLSALFSLMLRTPSSGTAGRSRISIPIESVTQYITAHFKEPITLEQMAAMASLSVSYFSRLFKNTTGFGFKEYLTIIRLKEAKALLLHTDTSICEIAYACGFNDSNYFSSVFKDLHGISPLRYRAEKRIKADRRHPAKKKKR